MDFKNKNILVTGGTGFIGAALVNKLISLNCYVHIIDNDIKNKLWRINNLSLCKFFEIDITNLEEIIRVINEIKPDIIFHFAAIVNTTTQRKIIENIYSTNLKGTQNLILSLHDRKYIFFLNTGTSEVYAGNTPPFEEKFRENPISPYSASKLAATNFCRMYSSLYNKPIYTIRPFLPYGPKQISNNLIPSLMYSSFTKKK
jgi:nucleoside-diphosphate-sugar epimerase